ncbi:MAG: VCBS repeat-containing protein, partial [Myxococcota bacterium]
MTGWHTAGATGRRLFLAATAAFLAVAGCECSETNTAIFVFEPEDGAVITLTDDVDGDPSNGVQIDVAANTAGIGSGETLQLRVDGEVVDEADVRDESVLFSAVDVPGGDHELVVCSGDDCNVQSNTVRISVQASCPSIDFVAPAPPSMGDTLTLGPNDDSDGEPCGTQFTQTIRVATGAPTGSPVRLEVNGSTRGTAVVEGSLATFEDVVLDNTGDRENEITAYVEVDGVECARPYPATVLVDCAEPSCAVTAPAAEGGFLNLDDDENLSMDGLQSTVEVTTDADVVDEQVDFFVDGALVASQPVSAAGTDGIASFSNLTLEEGTQSVHAVCRDDLGNVKESATLTWEVDLTPCEPTVTSIGGHDATLDPIERILSEDDDVDGDPSNGIQVDVEGVFSGSEAAQSACHEVRAVVGSSCDAIDGVTFEPVGDPDDPTRNPSTYTAQVTVPTLDSASLCVQARDQAGNRTLPPEQADVLFESDLPAVAIESPDSGARYNASGGTYEDGSGDTRDYIVDGDPSTTSCNAEITVSCEDSRGTVSILRDGETTPLVGGGPVDCPEGGELVFPDVRLPRLNDAAEFNLVAEHEVGNLSPSRSEPVSLRADCGLPSINELDPSCPDELSPEADDSDPDTGEFEYTVRVGTTSSDVSEVDIVIFKEPDTSGDPRTEQDSATIAWSSTSTARFSDAFFGSSGNYTIESCTTDLLDNEGCLECPVTVGDLPEVTIQEPQPADGQVYSAEDDCDDSDEDFQIQVAATTDAPDGADATITTGESDTGTTTPATVSGGMVSACVGAPQGEDVPIQVSVTDPVTELVGSAQVHVDIDSIPPEEPIDDLALVSPQPDLPRHTFLFEWTAVPDGDGTALESYDFRCAGAPIDTEADWDAARPHGFVSPVTPAASGTQQAEVWGFRPGRTVHCMVRGADPAGSLTPMNGSAEVVTPDWNTLTVTTDTGSSMGQDKVTGVGDVNGDGVDDVVFGGNGEAYLYFGFGGSPPAGDPVPPDVTLRGDGAGFFGWRLAALGDFDGDGRPDFAVSALNQNSNKGAVYIFLGRASTDPWPSSIDVTDPECPSGVICLIGDDGVADAGPDEGAFFGRSLAGVGDFDGDDVADIAIGAPGAEDDDGRVYVLMGGQLGAGTTTNIPESTAVDGFVLPAASNDKRLGWALAALGTSFGTDGLDDLVVSAAGDDASSTPGALYILEGRPLPMDGGLTEIDPAVAVMNGSLVEIVREGPFGDFAQTVVSANDLNGDGIYEIALRSAGLEEVRVFIGSAGGYSDSSTYVIDNDSSGGGSDAFGTFMGQALVPGLAARSDIDGDG